MNELSKAVLEIGGMAAAGALVGKFFDGRQAKEMLDQLPEKPMTFAEWLGMNDDQAQFVTDVIDFVPGDSTIGEALEIFENKAQDIQFLRGMANQYGLDASIRSVKLGDVRQSFPYPTPRPTS